MRPLNRPMFRYGGPIKEGIMDGIREPKKNGGSMSQLVKPSADGSRPGYAGPGLLALPYIGAGLRLAARPFGKFITRQAQKFFQGPMRRYYEPPGYTKNVAETIFQPNRLGLAFKNDPLAKTIMTGSGFVGRGIRAGGKGIYNVGKYATTTPSGLTFLGAPVIYSAGKYFLSDGTELNDNQIKQIKQEGPPGGGDPGMFLTPQAKGDEGATLSAEELRKRRVDRYRDIMDIKGMNKAAAYDSLIAASKAINESTDFKGDLKSGKLINQIIQGASKAFDKPKATKDAIDTLILKGEIEKDIKASDPQAARQAELLEKKIAIADKTLAGDSFTDIITERYKKGKVPRGKELAGILRATEGVEVTTVDSTKIPQGVDAQTFFESQINEAKEKGTAVVPGYYVIDDRVLIVDAQGNVTPVL